MPKLIIDENDRKNKIEAEVYGHFSEHLGRCIYDGLYVGEKSEIPNNNGIRIDAIEALKELKVPVLRWPGGCFADEYHWMDGIGPKDKRKKMVNTNWGKVTEDNSFGTHEYMELCKELNCKTYVNGNLGSGTVKEMSEWVEYMTFDGISPMADLRRENGHDAPWRVNYFGVGNENWGGGGNMRPEYYADLYRQYQTYIRIYDTEKPIKKVCCGPNADDYDWTKKLLKAAFERSLPESHGFMDYLSLHYYTIPGDWNKKGSATDFSDEDWYITLFKALKMDEIIKKHSAIMDVYDPEEKIGLCVDEWGSWYDCEPGTNPGFLYQQNTLRDALIAGITLNIFNKNSNRVKLAALAQICNVLQSVILTKDDMLIKTPTYHVMHMYRHHQNGYLLNSKLSEVGNVGPSNYSVPKLTESVSIDSDNIITLTINNLSIESSEQLEIDFNTDNVNYKVIESKILTADKYNDKNTFSEPENVEEKDFKDYKEEEKIIVNVPKSSVIMMRFKKV